MALKALKQAEYYLFARWIATPCSLRTPKTQKQFSDLYKVGHDTLARWKKDQGFTEDVKRSVMDWTKELLPNVIWSLYNQAMTGDPRAIKLWLEHFNNLNVKDGQDEQRPQNYIDLILEQYEAELKTKT